MMRFHVSPESHLAWFKIAHQAEIGTKAVKVRTAFSVQATGFTATAPSSNMDPGHES